MESMGRMLLIVGALFVALGLLFVAWGRTPLGDSLPGDIRIEWGNMSCYFPLISGILLSILATIVLNLIIWLVRK